MTTTEIPWATITRWGDNNNNEDEGTADDYNKQNFQRKMNDDNQPNEWRIHISRIIPIETTMSNDNKRNRIEIDDTFKHDSSFEKN